MEKLYIFRDSYLFLPLSLRNLADAFKLKVKKGFFPHKLNTIENMDKIISFPAPEEFVDIDSFKTEQAKNDFYAWYQKSKSKNGGKYNVSAELLEYCEFC